MPRKIEQPTTDQYGAEVHPAFGMIKAHRVSAVPGAVLFDSDIRHQHYMTLEIETASRKRDLNTDWIYGGRTLIEVEMSEAQWASFVSSPNTSGVPCTIARRETDWDLPGLPFAPRMAESMREVHDAATSAFAKIKEARDVYEKALADKAPAKERNLAQRNLHYAIENATSGVDFASKQLREHTENVVQRARADIEAIVSQKAQQLGIDPTSVTAPFAIEGQVEEPDGNLRDEGYLNP